LLLESTHRLGGNGRESGILALANALTHDSIANRSSPKALRSTHQNAKRFVEARTGRKSAVFWLVLLSDFGLVLLSCNGIRPMISDNLVEGTWIRSIGIEIEEGSVSFRIVNELLLVDFEVRSLVSVIGSPESIQIPSSIEELRSFCCFSKMQLKIVEFESDWTLRWIGRLAFAECRLLESICIPSSVEVLRECCFLFCSSLRTVTFGAESRLRLIEKHALQGCRSPRLVSAPASVEVIGPRPFTFVSRQ
jgi:hypothetical protein